MPSMTVTLFFSGLIAFVPNSSQDPSSMTAYLLAHGHHEPLLRVKLKDVSSCPCRQVAGYCECGLANRDMTIVPPLQTSSRFLRPRSYGGLPSFSNADDLSWLVRLREAEDGVARIGEWKDIESKVAGRLTFGWEEAFVCEFDVSDNDSHAYVHAMEFKEGQEVYHVQAVAEAVGFRASLPIGPFARIELRELDDDPKLVGTIVLKCSGARCPDITISNDSSESCECERDSEEGCAACDVGEHFVAYYELDRDDEVHAPIPWRKLDLYVDESLLKLEKERCSGRAVSVDYNWTAMIAKKNLGGASFADFGGGATVGSKIICPMAILEP